MAVSTQEQGYYGYRLREMRRSRDLTLDEVSRQTGISTSYLSKIERNRANLTLGYLKTLADFYDLPLISLMEPGEESGSAVVHAGQGAVIESGGVALELLRGTDEGKMEPILGRHGPGTESGKMYSHEGEEFKYILQGRLIYYVGDEEYDLREGDSIYHKASIPHGWANPTDETTLVLSVVTPASFLM